MFPLCPPKVAVTGADLELSSRNLFPRAITWGAPAELHLFENTYYAERINVVLAFSAEAIAELAGRLG